MKIQKFGGTSVGSVERIKAVEKLINDGERKLVVLSAMSGTTNTLVEIGNALYAGDVPRANQIITQLEEKYRRVVEELYHKEKQKHKASEFLDLHFNFMKGVTQQQNFTEREERALLAEGEILSTHLVQFYLEEIGVPSVLLNALDFMRIDADQEPELDYISENLKKEVARYPDTVLFLTQGYICRNANNEIDNLKRGGSDYTASLVGAALDAQEIQIWTDIDGMHNNDPRIVDKTFPVAELSFEEAAELAYFGAKILHPSTVLPAKLKDIPVRILNTMAPQMRGTLITANPSGGNDIKAIAAKDGITAIKIRSTRMLLAYGFLRRLFEVFERYRTPIDMITTAEVEVSVTIDNTGNLEKIVRELEGFSHVEVDADHTIVCIVGNMINSNTGYANKIFSALENIPVRMISYGGSKHNVSILIDTVHKKQVLNELNRALFNLS